MVQSGEGGPSASPMLVVKEQGQDVLLFALRLLRIITGGFEYVIPINLFIFLQRV